MAASCSPRASRRSIARSAPARVSACSWSWAPSAPIASIDWQQVAHQQRRERRGDHHVAARREHEGGVVEPEADGRVVERREHPAAECDDQHRRTRFAALPGARADQQREQEEYEPDREHSLQQRRERELEEVQAEHDRFARRSVDRVEESAARTDSAAAWLPRARAPPGGRTGIGTRIRDALNSSAPTITKLAPAIDTRCACSASWASPPT